MSVPGSSQHRLHFACAARLQVIHCIENGLPLLIENLPEDIDPVLDNVIQVSRKFQRYQVAKALSGSSSKFHGR